MYKISPSPSPVSPSPVSPVASSPISPFRISPDVTFEVENSVLRWTPIVLLILAILIVFADLRRRCHDRFPTPTRPLHQLPPRRRLRGPRRTQPRPPTPQQPTEPISSILCTYRIEKPEAAASGSDCAICLDDFKYGDECRMFVSCNHGFHRACIDEWLARNGHCPLCRGSIRGLHSLNIDRV